MTTTVPKVRTVPSDRIPGAWRAKCECGWVGKLYGARGARDAARSDRWRHELDHEDGVA